MQIKEHRVLIAREIRNFGFTLIEVMISLVLIGAGLAFSTKVFVAGKYFLKEAENKARAMEIASLKMNEYITKSYKDLEAAIGTISDPITTDFFDWQVNISSATLPAVVPGANAIPYIEIEVLCTYNEKDINGRNTFKTVRLINMVPYPTMHLLSGTGPSPTVVKYAQCFPSGVDPCWSLASTVYASSGNRSASQIISVPITVKVKSDLLIFYNISLDIAQPPTGIGVGDLILSKSFLLKPDGSRQELEIQTGTPVLTQPSINNVVSVANLAANANPYYLEIMWFKDHAAGSISLKKINVAIFQVEKFS